MKKSAYVDETEGLRFSKALVFEESTFLRAGQLPALVEVLMAQSSCD
ncbi:MAG: hypothetical protein H6970_05755 [Gammaproteobacteria bacterium]|nr:hypothetical protein [Gammaproteobacteria bacterium]